MISVILKHNTNNWIGQLASILGSKVNEIYTFKFKGSVHRGCRFNRKIGSQNLILALLIGSLFSEPQILSYKMRPVDEMTLHSSNIFQ